MVTIVVSKKVIFAIIGLLLLIVWLSVSNLQTQKNSYAILAEYTERLDQALDKLLAPMASDSFEEAMGRLGSVIGFAIPRSLDSIQNDLSNIQSDLHDIKSDLDSIVIERLNDIKSDLDSIVIERLNDIESRLGGIYPR